MYTAVIIVACILILIVLLRVIFLISPCIRFFVRGLNSGFGFAELRFLWPIGDAGNPDSPAVLFESVALLDKSIAAVLKKAEKDKTTNSQNVQSFLKRLYDCRTKVELDPNAKNGINDTRYISKGQELRILVRGVGVFFAHVMQNGRQLIISLPLENGELTVSGDKWVHKKIVVYFHRQDDAFYVFDTTVLRNLLFNGRNALALAHSSSLLRSQKRRSVRCKCRIPAWLFLGAKKPEDRVKLEPQAGFKCMLEDLSEDGSLIRIGGKAKAGMPIKLQFALDDKRVVMYGLAKSVSYDKKTEESHIHFQCTETTAWFKNTVLAYVYKNLPEKEALF